MAADHLGARLAPVVDDRAREPPVRKGRPHAAPPLRRGRQSGAPALAAALLGAEPRARLDWVARSNALANSVPQRVAQALGVASVKDLEWEEGGRGHLLGLVRLGSQLDRDRAARGLQVGARQRAGRWRVEGADPLRRRHALGVAHARLVGRVLPARARACVKADTGSDTRGPSGGGMEATARARIPHGRHPLRARV
eukprot:scaffold120245_cov24-Tisochrysis_lutea.AAC.1